LSMFQVHQVIVDILIKVLEFFKVIFFPQNQIQEYSAEYWLNQYILIDCFAYYLTNKFVVTFFFFLNIKILFWISLPHISCVVRVRDELVERSFFKETPFIIECLSDDKIDEFFSESATVNPNFLDSQFVDKHNVNISSEISKIEKSCVGVLVFTAPLTIDDFGI
jgi:hypothetical protein